MKVGFTGTQQGMTMAQRHNLASILRGAEIELHHGDCVGADAGAHSIATDLGCAVVIHPPKNPSKRAWCRPCKEMREEGDYLDRNKNIVLETDQLIAAPQGMTEELRSGTWSTVRFARKLGRPIFILYPDGTTESHSGHKS